MRSGANRPRHTLFLARGAAATAAVQPVSARLPQRWRTPSRELERAAQAHKKRGRSVARQCGIFGRGMARQARANRHVKHWRQLAQMEQGAARTAAATLSRASLQDSAVFICVHSRNRHNGRGCDGVWPDDATRERITSCACRTAVGALGEMTLPSIATH